MASFKAQGNFVFAIIKRREGVTCCSELEHGEGELAGSLTVAASSSAFPLMGSVATR